MEKIAIISCLVWGVYITLQEGMIFARLGDIIEETLGEFWAKPVARCVICCSFWYGSAFYWLIWGYDWREWLIVVVAAMGLNTILTRLMPDKE